MTGSQWPCAPARSFCFHLRPGQGSGNEPAGPGATACVPSGSPVSLPDPLGFTSGACSPVCCPWAGPHLCWACLIPSHIPLSWHGRCSCPVSFPSNVAPVFVCSGVSFLNMEVHQFSSTSCLPPPHPCTWPIAEPLPSLEGDTLPS